MAVIDTNKTKKPYIVDRDENISIGIDMPFRVGDRGEGWGASSTTTLQAVKNDLKNLVSTEVGERLYQPLLGVALRKFLFEPFTESMVDEIKTTIFETVSYWLPFVEVRDIQVETMEDNRIVGANQVKIKILFNIKRDPNTLDSVTLNFSNDTSEPESSVSSGDGY